SRRRRVLVRRFKIGALCRIQDAISAAPKELCQILAVFRDQAKGLVPTLFRTDQHFVQRAEVRETRSEGFGIDGTRVKPELGEQFENLLFLGFALEIVESKLFRFLVVFQFEQVVRIADKLLQKIFQRGSRSNPNHQCFDLTQAFEFPDRFGGVLDIHALDRAVRLDLVDQRCLQGRKLFGRLHREQDWRSKEAKARRRPYWNFIHAASLRFENRSIRSKDFERTPGKPLRYAGIEQAELAQAQNQ